jgi:hypothetical protein
MATVIVTLFQAMAGASNAPVRRGAARSETIASSGTAASGAFTSTTGEVAAIYCDTALYASVTGTAAAASGHYIPAATLVEIAFTQAGQSVSVIDA